MTITTLAQVRQLMTEMTIEEFFAPSPAATAYKCPECASGLMRPSQTPAGEAVVECDNQACGKCWSAELVGQLVVAERAEEAAPKSSKEDLLAAEAAAWDAYDAADRLCREAIALADRLYLLWLAAPATDSRARRLSDRANQRWYRRNEAYHELRRAWNATSEALHEAELTLADIEAAEAARQGEPEAAEEAEQDYQEHWAEEFRVAEILAEADAHLASLEHEAEWRASGELAEEPEPALTPFALGQALAVELARIERHARPEDQPSLTRAALRAVEKLRAGVAWERRGDVLLFASESAQKAIEAGNDVPEDLRWHQCPPASARVAPELACSCQAASNGRACWHIPARRLLLTILGDAMQAAA